MQGRGGDGRLDDLIARFRRWTDAPEKVLASTVGDMCRLDRREIQTLIGTSPDLFGQRTIRLLIDRAHQQIGDSPRDAADLCRLAIKIADNLWSDRPEEDVGLLGDAWRELASCLFSAGEWVSANEACQNAALYYAVVSPLRAIESSRLALILGQVMHELGQSDEGLALIERHAHLFKSFYNDRHRYVDARTIYAVVLLKRQDYSSALAALEESARIATEEKDTQILAYILNNIGLCWINLGNPTKAKECLTAAVEMFATRNLRAESARVRGSLALLLVSQGKYNEAISEYYICRRIFLELGMPVVAAQAGLRVVEVLFLAGRTSQVPTLCAELVRTFTDAQLPREARKALAYLNELAASQTAHEPNVRFVREFMERLERNPEAVFAPETDEG